ncbi:MAG: endopeptidase La [Proteobacteria bacterium]|nr:endopeptidase La [Pseudomonadota bacterium]
MPMLPVRDVVIFPYMIIPLFVGRESSIKAVDEALAKDRIIFLSAQKNVEDEDPKPKEIYKTGTISMIMRMLKLPDGRVKILVQGLTRGKIKRYLSKSPYFKLRVEKCDEPQIPEITLEVEAMMRNIKEQLSEIVNLGSLVAPELLQIVDDMNDPGRLADLIISNIGMKVEDSQHVLEIVDPLNRLKMVGELLGKELEVMTMQAKIQSMAKDEMTKGQREYFLREQLKAIRQELGDTDELAQEVDELRGKIRAASMPEDTETEALKQLGRLERMHPDSSESSVLRTYVEWLAELPWSISTEDNLDIVAAKKVLDEDHYDLEKVKDRILEYLSVRKLTESKKGPILCFVGPPGVGKTSLGRSIARAMDRKFIRMSVGGMRDEAEIRGHRRTYVGALPGRIIQNIKQTGSNNPIIMLDEVDKIGSDFRGDPASALLEVLDPEQNNAFTDHYLAVPFDLSNVMFITTANMLDPIPSALRDRMEVLELSGYTEEEKMQIARRFLIPRQMTANGLKEEDIHISDPALGRIISQHTREAGLRNLEREIGSVCRKIARGLAEGRKKKTVVTAGNLSKFLGAAKFIPEAEREKNEVGVTTGLAWTQAGGEILYVESSLMKGKGGLTLTGKLGDVMKESGQAALSYTRANAERFGVDGSFFEDKEIHVHVPSGAIPKDGPSAGITMATSLVSSVTGIAVRKDVAMTGEITLRGKVLPIGGLKDKSLAAMRANIGTIIIPEQNVKDLEEIPAHLRKRMEFIPVSHVDEVLRAALVRDPFQSKVKKNLQKSASSQ